ncbi:MAG: type II toxin-antitoxin system RelB/DinJ family antitoxin [Lachnospiraceae bacterium]|nr:type II toxin-antitoxin system RelB/DinJ family antitoxin [Lachnospiraceae bacterium]
MSKTATVFTRVDPEVKKQAEAVLNELGIPMSSAINIFLKQVVLHQGIPFQLTLRPLPSNMVVQTQEEFEAAVRKGLEDVEAGRLRSSDELKQEMKDRYGL